MYNPSRKTCYSKKNVFGIYGLTSKSMVVDDVFECATI